MGIWTALLCAHLRVLTIQCDRCFYTEVHALLPPSTMLANIKQVTVEVLMVVQAHQWITRNDRLSHIREWMGTRYCEC